MILDTLWSGAVSFYSCLVHVFPHGLGPEKWFQNGAIFVNSARPNMSKTIISSGNLTWQWTFLHVLILRFEPHLYRMFNCHIWLQYQRKKPWGGFHLSFDWFQGPLGPLNPHYFVSWGGQSMELMRFRCSIFFLFNQSIDHEISWYPCKMGWYLHRPWYCCCKILHHFMVGVSHDNPGW